MNFVSVKKAKELIFQNSKNMSKNIRLPLLDSLGYFLVEDIIAPIDVPNFDNSAMDGYCFRYRDLKKNIPLVVKKVIQTGETNLPILNTGEAIRIFTGAPVPKGADTVVIQEDTEVCDSILKIKSSEIKRGSNIRLRGSQSKKNHCIVKKNTKITSGIVSFLAGFGIDEVLVYQKPKIGIIVSGKELMKSGSLLKIGEIYESNSISLQALLKEIYYQVEEVLVLDDDIDLLRKKITETLSKVDVLVITGGMSVGDYDFVKHILEDIQVEKIFYKVTQKPGKPIFFGKKDEKYIFGLPGNPAAVFSCFHIYVKPFLESLSGQIQNDVIVNKAKLKSDFEKKTGLTYFVKAHFKNGEVEILKNQNSYQMDAFVKANCLVKLDSKKSLIKKGKDVEIISI